jgi:crotonobetainyl-CoA:carnitine CoA-transferase CaiB-like acyl-CoA transferase
MKGPLDGLRVLDISEFVAGPLAGMLLADLGADVIKIEPPAGESGRHVVQSAGDCRGFLAINRGKRAIAVDLKSEPGQEIVHRLARTADAVIVNYRADTAAALKIDYETLRSLNDQLIYMDNTAMGPQGPDAGRPGYDLIVQAVSGLMTAGGRTDDDGAPLPLKPPVVDLATGVVIAWGICAALLARERGAGGQRVQSSLLGTALLLQGATFLQVDGPPPDPDWTDPALPYYRTYSTADGRVAVTAVTPVMRRRFEDVVGVVHPLHARRDIPRDGPEAAEASRNFIAEVAAALARKTTDEWVGAFDRAGVPAGPVREVEQLVGDPQVAANELEVRTEHAVLGSMTMVGPVLQFSATPPDVKGAPPTVGQHTAEVLSDLGYLAEEITALIDLGVVRMASPHAGIAK